MREFAVILFLVVALPATGFTQSVDDVGRDSTTTVVVVPKLTSAVFLEGTVGQRLSIFNRDLPELPLAFGGGAGYRLFLEGHGRTHLRFGASFEYGRDAFKETRFFHLGATIAFAQRFYSQLFAFVGTSFAIVGGYNSYELPGGDGFGDPARFDGFEIGAELEFSFGSIAWSEPFLFAEVAFTLAPKIVSVGPAEGFYVGGNAILRFDWAFEDREFLKAPDNSEWE